MSITNLGNQYITFDYKHPATAKDFNTLLKGAIKPGIYSGGDITITGANTISVAPFIAYLYSDTDKLVRVETRLAVALTIAESTPVLSITLPWANVVENWLDWNQRAHGSAVITNEVCLGEMVFVANAINSIDYTVKNYGLYNEDGVLRIPIATGTAPIEVNSITKVSNLNVDKIDDCDVQTTMTYSNSYIPTSKAILDYLFPIGDIYVQYPVAESNVEATAFPTTYRPATKFGGTWSELYDDEDVFFRTKGTDGQARSNGLSLDQMQGHIHLATVNPGGTPGAGSYIQKTTVAGSNTNGVTIGNPSDDGTNGPPRTGTKTEPKNRLFKVWIRTA